MDGHSIKAFAKEKEPEDRTCLFCKAKPPEELRMVDMRGGKARWYSNSLLHIKSQRIVRFYLCPNHQNRKAEAWQWARDGFIEQEVVGLKGMEAVRAWLSCHPELRSYLEK